VIKYEKNERVVQLKLDIPQVNVLDTKNCRFLTEKLTELSEDQTIAAIFLSGEGKCFSAGASVEEHKKEYVNEMIKAFSDACTAIYNFPAPVIALVHGFCFGGGLEMSMYCDFVFADPSSKLGVPEISLAFFPPLACSILPEIVGRQNAAHMILSGETIDAEKGQSIGLIQKIVPGKEWDKIISRYNKISAPVLRIAKKALRAADKSGGKKLINEDINNLFLNDLYKIDDVNEGINSFIEKRVPKWLHC